MEGMKLADSVLHRIIQILQEAILLGIDVSDIMRQIRLVPDSSDPHVLVLTEDYVKQVSEWHKKLLDDAEQMSQKLKGEETTNKLIVS